jgi:hypothetical protein
MAPTALLLCPNEDIQVNTRKLTVPLLLLVLSVAACAPTSKYNWGNYSPALVAMDENATMAPSYEKALARIVNNPAGKVPPGIFAEYGYVLQQKDDVKGAVAMYAREKAAWPESATLMDKMTESLQSARSHQHQSQPVS